MPGHISTNRPPLIGIAGWKNSGKTTLVVRLVEEFTRRGLVVATVKHSHHSLAIDEGKTDSARHRRAGAREVAVIGADRWAIMRELHGEPEPGLDEVVGCLAPADLVIVEGYKQAPIPKIELRRAAQADKRALAEADPHVFAIAADHDLEDAGVPVFALDDIRRLADFIERVVGPLLPRAVQGSSGGNDHA